MNWSFEIVEVSNGAYSCKGRRSTGNIVLVTCGENEIYRIFEEAFGLETELGTLPGEALYLVVSGTKPYWNSQFNKEAFSSWIVAHPNGNKRFVYDGKDFILMAYGDGEEPVWQGQFRDKGDISEQFLKKLL